LEGIDAIGRASKAPNLRPAKKGPGGPTISQKERVSLSTECPSCTTLVVVVSGERTQGGTTAKSQRIRRNLILHDDDVECNF